MTPKYGSNFTLCYMDIDSLVYEIETAKEHCKECGEKV